MIDTPQPFDEAIRHLLDKEQLPAEWDAATWSAQAGDFRTQAFFASRVENARFLDRAQTLVFDYLAKVREDVTTPDGERTTALSVADRSHFVERMRQFMIEEGMATAEEFKDVKQGDVQDIRSLARLNLIFDTQVRTAYGFGQWTQGMQPAVLRAFPAARLIRERGVAVPRPRHQASLGEVRLKTDFPWWADFQNAKSIGGFEVPWGPYGFHSGVNQEDVSRKEARALGLPVDTVAKGMEKTPPITTGTQASTRNMDPELKKKLIRELRNGPKPRDPEEAAREAAANTRRIMLNRGLNEAVERGDVEKADRYRKAIAALPPAPGLSIVDEGDAVRLAKREFRQPEMVGPGGVPFVVPDEMAADFRANALSPSEVNRGLVEGLSDRLQERLREEVARSAGLEHERGVILTPDGGIKGRSIGGETSVSADAGTLDGAVFFHNHPDGNPLSLEDLEALFATGLEMVMAAGGDDLYTAKIGTRGNGPDVHADLRIRFSYLNDVAYAVVSDLVRRGEIGIAAAEKAHIHAVLCQLAKEGLIDYSRTSYGARR